MTTMVSIDPDWDRGSGWAFWRDGTLVKCGIGYPEDSIYCFDEVVVEGQFTHLNPASAMKLAMVAGAMCSIFGHIPQDAARVAPSTWKGCKKTKALIDYPVLDSVVTELREADGELECFINSINSLFERDAWQVVDATAIGLFWLGRLERVVGA